MAAQSRGGPDELKPAQSERMRQCRERAQPTPRTVRNGDTVWFPYTAHQWMRGRIISFGRHGLRVQVMGGELPRIIRVSWADAHWHQRRDAC